MNTAWILLLAFIAVAGLTVLWTWLLPRYDWYCALRTKIFHVYPAKGVIVGRLVGPGEYETGIVTAVDRRQNWVLVESWYRYQDENGDGLVAARADWVRADSLRWMPWWSEL